MPAAVPYGLRWFSRSIGEYGEYHGSIGEYRGVMSEEEVRCKVIKANFAHSFGLSQN